MKENSFSFQWHAFLTAIQFLTRVPVPGGMNRPAADPALLPACLVYFPLVGTLIGLSTGLWIFAASQLFSIVIAVLLGLLAEALLTGAFHEDAVADCADAFGGGWTREQTLEILKDSRLGTFGTLGLGFAVALRGFGLADVPAGLWPVVGAVAGGLGRFAILPLMKAVPPIPLRESLSKDIAATISLRMFVFPGLIALGLIVLAIGTFGFSMVIGLMLSALIVVLWAYYVRKRLGGMCGDALGAGCYFVQIILTLTATCAR